MCSFIGDFDGGLIVTYTKKASLAEIQCLHIDGKLILLIRPQIFCSHITVPRKTENLGIFRKQGRKTENQVGIPENLIILHVLLV